jgi:hypothetical protein
VFAFFSPGRREADPSPAVRSRPTQGSLGARPTQGSLGARPTQGSLGARGTPATQVPAIAARATALPTQSSLGTREWKGADPNASVLDDYIAARFPGVAGGAQRLEDIEQVIRTARLYFEEQKTDRAQELLDLAIVRSPANKALRLAQLELAFLTADGPLFTGLARQFLATHPESTEWSEIGRLGRAIAPGESLFGADPGARVHEHYGPWPDLPNWIQASWDLTSEVLAADFHRAMATTAATGKEPT